MRHILLLTFALFTTIANGAPPLREPPASGRYAFAGEFTVVLRRHFETVYAFTPSGLARLEVLRGAGAECADRGRDTYLCRVPPPKRCRRPRSRGSEDEAQFNLPGGGVLSLPLDVTLEESKSTRTVYSVVSLLRRM